ncbi:indolepyruvate ferredoxin oxidoreductase family protein [Oricola cellulosilytica]|uniref:Indolepyruvate ferredoxin oxidoreductase family protein n=1 Tax=Oricola cellulosilytica TaxID=1429082 RepID=A0A4R0P7D2_9HYPH|nr:indolepyruvate ferredoxin oxidoreductase family protein [Oricola cellulosilytica]TCD11385.1 indolepyruvate ferredoxin oxidoreductase family protein [Oricola cellulosilytica]
MALRTVTLGDKYDLSCEEVFVTGTQAIVRMMLMQRERDRRAGLNTAGFASGYRGSPIGGLDQQFWAAGDVLKKANIRFQPGLNEELAATACWGTQQAELGGHGKYDGVFALWYGKGPGVDRTCDVFRHANLAGSSKHGGVLALMGDDHTAESSTNAHQSEFAFVDTLIPIFNPAGVQEIIDYGLHAYAMSRFAGTWASMKCVKDNIESTGSVYAGLDRINPIIPEFEMPEGGVNIRRMDLDFVGQEQRLHRFKREAAVAYNRANKIDHVVWSGGRRPRLGLVAAGKNYLDLREALHDLGIDEVMSSRLGIRLYKVGMPWPLDPDDLIRFADGLHTIVVVEEKRGLIEVQIKEELYGFSKRPMVIGKRDEQNRTLFPIMGALDPNDIAIAVGERVLAICGENEEIAARVANIRKTQKRFAEIQDVASRMPTYCPGCPHNTSTVVPEGARASAGIGCHFMAVWMEREHEGFTQMGGEGANWVGEAPFSKRDHIFQNLGDGTYNHSGSLAIRFALAAGTNITYKILYNDAVAMTGGQHVEGDLTVDEIARQVRAEGVERIAVVTDEPEKYPGKVTFPDGSTVHHRDDLDAVQRELQEVPGVSVLLYDQTCAAEKRRRRKRGTYPDPDRRVIINELVCEGCGDCGVKSNCIAIQPVDTEFGRKRRIDQTACNKDFSCLRGFCPSFVTVHGGKLRKPKPADQPADPLAGVPAAPVFALDENRPEWAGLIDGIGGTGVVTIGAILGMAAHLEKKGVGIIDMAGLAQKGGAVFTHMRIGTTPEAISTIRVSPGKADLVLGCDIVVTGSRKILSAIRRDETLCLVNKAEVMPGDFARHREFRLPTDRLIESIREAVGDERLHFLDASRAAEALFANSIAANMFMLGHAAQLGGLPVSCEAVEEATRLNRQAIEMNIAAFRWGRRAAHDPAAITKLLETKSSTADRSPIARTLDDVIARRAEFLTDYHDALYAGRYLERIDAVKARETEISGKPGVITETVARQLFKLMAIKDEFEVARLYTTSSFKAQLEREFETFDKLEFHLAPPILGAKDASGHPRKSVFGPWMMGAFKVLARLKRLRFTRLNVFARTAERKLERATLDTYEKDIDRIAAMLDGKNAAAAAELAAWPEEIAGYGHIREKSINAALALRASQAVPFKAKI